MIVAVLDTGVAYDTTDVLLRLQPLPLSGARCPTLGTVPIPFAAAPDLGGRGAFRLTA